MRVKLGVPLTINEISDFTNGKTNSDKKALITHISTDTRDLQAGDLFVALCGEKFNGEDFSARAKELGAYVMSSCYSSASVIVKNTRESLISLAKGYKALIKVPYTVAITGSVGKTTTKELISHIASAKFKIHSTDKNFNNEIGVPMTIISSPADTDILILEMGMNNFGELSTLSHCATPDLVVITNIGTAHIGNLGSREMIARAKLEILDGASEKAKAIIPHGEALLSFIPGKITFSSSDSSADCYIENDSIQNGRFRYHSKRYGVIDVHLSLTGNHIRECLAPALSVCEEIGMNKSDLECGISKVPRELSRGVIKKVGKIIIFDDSYNSSTEAVESSLKTLISLPYPKKSAVLGDMHELGTYTEYLHKRIGEMSALSGISRLYTIGVYSEFIAKGAIDSGFDKNNIFKNSNPTNPYETAKQIFLNADDGEVILFKASHSLKLERVIDCLKELYEKTS